MSDNQNDFEGNSQAFQAMSQFEEMFLQDNDGATHQEALTEYADDDFLDELGGDAAQIMSQFGAQFDDLNLEGDGQGTIHQHPDDIMFHQTDSEALQAQADLEAEMQQAQVPSRSLSEEIDDAKRDIFDDVLNFDLPSDEDFARGHVWLPKFMHGFLQHTINGKENDKQIQDIYITLRTMLIDEEKIIYISTQRRPIINFLPDALVVTSRRMIIYVNKLFGFEIHDVQWKDMRRVKLYEDVFGVHILFALKDKITFYPFRYMRRQSGHDAYTLCQEMLKRGKRKNFRLILSKSISARPQFIVNGDHMYAKDIFEGLIPADSVPKIARGKGFVEFSEILDGNDGRKTYHELGDEDLRTIEARALHQATEQKEEVRRQIDEETKNIEAAKKTSKRIRHIDDSPLLDDLIGKVGQGAEKVRAEMLDELQEEGSVFQDVKARAASQPDANTRRNSRKDARRMAEEMKKAKRNKNK